MPTAIYVCERHNDEGGFKTGRITEKLAGYCRENPEEVFGRIWSIYGLKSFKGGIDIETWNDRYYSDFGLKLETTQKLQGATINGTLDDLVSSGVLEEARFDDKTDLKLVSQKIITNLSGHPEILYSLMQYLISPSRK